MLNLIDCFSVVKDPRIERGKKHKLIDIIVIAICGTICRCSTWTEIEEWGNTHKDFLKKFLEIKHGIPSDDTFSRVFSLLDSTAVENAFYEWSSSLNKVIGGELIAIDGKFFKASLEESYNKKSMIGTVSAWLTESGISLLHKKIQQYTKCEQDGFLEILDALNIEGKTITMDANGCHAKITKKIIEKKGNYSLALKSNQKVLLRMAKDAFEKNNNISRFETYEKSHGREELRICESINLEADFSEWVHKRSKQRHYEKWHALNSVIRLRTKIIRNGRPAEEERYFISSLKADAEKQLKIIRSHWGIENNLHRTMDIFFDEDRSRTRSGYGAENMSVIRKIALNLLNQDRTTKKVSTLRGFGPTDVRNIYSIL